MPKAPPKSAKKPKRVPSPQGPAAAYSKAVTKQLAKQSRDSTYRPEKPLTLKVQNARMPASVEELGPEERVQLRAVFGKRLERALGNEETQLEAAEVVDETGAIRYRLYGANFGEGYLFPAEGLDLIAFAAQHDVEHWSLSQRPIFYAMDAALRAGSHGFMQPLTFCWWREECWKKLEGTRPGRVGSEPHVRKRIAQNSSR
jgi:hypothetical protein